MKKKKVKKIPTRQLLIETAGELFAEYGMKGTSIKMIADQSNQNIAAVNYHFGSKKNLFVETLNFVIEKMREHTDTKPVKITAKNFRAELNKFISSRCKLLLSKSKPTWYGGLLVRAFHEASKPGKEIAIEFFYPDIELLEKMAKAAKPKITPFAAKLWAYSVIAQIIFYIYGRRMILATNNRKVYSTEFINDIAENIFKISLAGLKT
ncbi:MAG: hypothetical protein Kow0029_30090 [Candidatus Rifleibacteriota bacterium]